MQEVANSAFFAGTFTHRIDGKGRVSIPARWRSEFKAEVAPHLFVASSAKDRAIECVTQTDLRRRNAEQTGRTELSQRQRGLLGLHHFHSYTALQIDPEGRVQLPGAALVAAKIADKGPATGRAQKPTFIVRSQSAELLGAGDRFYIIHPDWLDDFLAQASAEAEVVDRGSMVGT